METEAVSAFVYQLSTMAYFFIVMFCFVFLLLLLYIPFFLYSHHPLQKKKKKPWPHWWISATCVSSFTWVSSLYVLVSASRHLHVHIIYTSVKRCLYVPSLVLRRDGARFGREAHVVRVVWMFLTGAVLTEAGWLTLCCDEGSEHMWNTYWRSSESKSLIQVVIAFEFLTS